MAYHSFENLEFWKDSCRVAEGGERNTLKDTARFFHIAKGSCAELRTPIDLSSKMDLLDQKMATSLADQTKKISSQFQKLITTTLS